MKNQYRRPLLILVSLLFLGIVGVVAYGMLNEEPLPAQVEKIKEEVVQAIKPAQTKEEEVGAYLGAWESHDVEFDLELKLKEEGGEIVGTYCAGLSDGSRTDCDPDAYSMRGRTEGDALILAFTDAYGGGDGVVTLMREGAGLRWTLSTAPEGEYYLPASAFLSGE